MAPRLCSHPAARTLSPTAACGTHTHHARSIANGTAKIIGNTQSRLGWGGKTKGEVLKSQTHNDSSEPRSFNCNRKLRQHNQFSRLSNSERSGTSSRTSSQRLASPINSRLLPRLRQGWHMVTEGLESGRTLFGHQHYSQPGEPAARSVRRGEEGESRGGSHLSYLLLLRCVTCSADEQ